MFITYDSNRIRVFESEHGNCKTEIFISEGIDHASLSGNDELLSIKTKKGYTHLYKPMRKGSYAYIRFNTIYK